MHIIDQSVDRLLLTFLQATQLGPKTTNFWLLVHALGEFVKTDGGGFPPLSGEVIDVESDKTVVVVGKSQKKTVLVTPEGRSPQS